MHPYVRAAELFVGQCYAKAATHLENEVLPKCQDDQTRQRIQWLIEEAKKAAAESRGVAPSTK